MKLGILAEIERNSRQDDLSSGDWRGEGRHWLRRTTTLSPRRKHSIEAVFSREASVGQLIEDSIRSASRSIHAALYRFNSRRLARALSDAYMRGTDVRLVVDKGRFESSRATRELLGKLPFPGRLAQGKAGQGSKMHHKFVVLDERTVLTGSYNWTYASEEKNHENLLVLSGQQLVEAHLLEFNELWTEGLDAELAAEGR